MSSGAVSLPVDVCFIALFQFVKSVSAFFASYTSCAAASGESKRPSFIPSSYHVAHLLSEVILSMANFFIAPSFNVSVRSSLVRDFCMLVVTPPGTSFKRSAKGVSFLVINGVTSNTPLSFIG